MAKRHTNTTKADGSDPYSAQRFMKARRSHHASATSQNAQHKPWLQPLWGIVILGMLVFAAVISLIS